MNNEVLVKVEGRELKAKSTELIAESSKEKNSIDV